MAGFSRPLDGSQAVVAINGSPQYLGTITSTTTKNNTDTAVPFTIPAGSVLLLQPTAAVQFLPGTTSATAATTGNGVKIAADGVMVVCLDPAEAYIACVGAADTRVYQLR